MRLTMRQYHELIQVKPAWRALVKADPHATFFSSPEWLQIWWEHHHHGREVLILALELNSRTVALALFQIERPARGLSGTRVAFQIGRAHV